MSEDDRFAELLDDLTGFYRSWVIYLGIETGLIATLGEASDGLTVADLADRAGCAPSTVDVWARAAYAFSLVERDGPAGPGVDDALAEAAQGDGLDGASTRFRMDPDVAAILTDDERRDFLGGQFAFTVGASLDHGGLVEVIRSGKPHPERSATFHRSVERLNTQDTALFLEQAVSSVSGLRESLEAGMAILDLACGGAGWLLAMAQAFPRITGTGVEFDAEWLATARQRVQATGLADRIAIEEGDPAATSGDRSYGLVYLQDVLHELADPVAVLSAAWRSVGPGGWLIVLDWCLPSSWEEYRTRQGELLWGYQLDELYQGTSLFTRAGFERRFLAADLPPPERIELEAGATLFVVRRAG